MPAKPLSEDQLKDAARLKAVFKKWQAARQREGLPHSQEWSSEQMGFGQSAMNQYLNGKIPLNLDAASHFADLTGVQISDFSPQIQELMDSFLQRVKVSIASQQEGSAGKLPQFVLQQHLDYIAKIIADADPNVRETAAGILGGLARNPQSVRIAAVALWAICKPSPEMTHPAPVSKKS